jgi:Flp pilus assembly protein TadD
MIDSSMRDAAAAWQRGDSLATERALERALRLRPNFSRALVQLAAVVQYRGDTAKALLITKKAIDADPKNGNLRISIAGLYELLSDGNNAMKAYKSATEVSPDDPRGFCGLASTYERMHLLEEARAAIDEAVHRFPDSPVAKTMYAKVLRRQGESEAALNELNEVLDSDLNDKDTYPAAFEKAKLLDKNGRYSEAFEAFKLANLTQARSAKMIPIPPNPTVKVCDEIRSFSSEQFAEWRSDDQLPKMKERIGFLFGFARSGTTMTDRILGTHENVVVFEEFPTIREMHSALNGLDPAKRPISQFYPEMQAAQVDKLRSAYRQAVIRRLTSKQAKLWGSGDLLVLDKFPLQLTAVGIISRALPEAKVMVALRDPRDVCLSCFMQHFSLNVSMAQMLDPMATAKYFIQLMSMWVDVKDRLAIDWLEVRYEDTVGDFNAQARRVLEFLELPWDDSLGEFHTHTPGTLISTPSYEAVSRPINSDAIGRWKNYREHIVEMIEALAPIAVRLGYEPA